MTFRIYVDILITIGVYFLIDYIPRQIMYFVVTVILEAGIVDKNWTVTR